MKHNQLIGIGILLLHCVLAQGGSSTPVKLTVTAQPIAAALNDFARQSGLHVVIDSDVARGITSSPVDGTFTAEDALVKLLANTGLQFEYLDATTVAILAKPARTRPKPAADARGGDDSLRLVRI